MLQSCRALGAQRPHPQGPSSASGTPASAPAGLAWRWRRRSGLGGSNTGFSMPSPFIALRRRCPAPPASDGRSNAPLNTRERAGPDGGSWRRFPPPSEEGGPARPDPALLGAVSGGSHRLARPLRRRGHRGARAEEGAAVPACLAAPPRPAPAARPPGDTASSPAGPWPASLCQPGQPLKEAPRTGRHLTLTRLTRTSGGSARGAGRAGLRFVSSSGAHPESCFGRPAEGLVGACRGGLRRRGTTARRRRGAVRRRRSAAASGTAQQRQ